MEKRGETRGKHEKELWQLKIILSIRLRTLQNCSSRFKQTASSQLLILEPLIKFFL